MSADPELCPPSEPANFSFAEEEPAPVNSLHDVISTPLPCPFCGGEPQIEVTRVILSDRTRVYCQCGASTRPDYNREEAIARWNRRAPLTPQQLEAIAFEVVTIQQSIERENIQHHKEEMLRRLYNLYPPKERKD